MSKKRKHDQVGDQDGSKITKQPPEEKSQPEVSISSAKSKGQLKQEKSERRAKKQKKSEEQMKGKDRSTSHASTISPSIAPAAAEEDSELDLKTKAKSERKAKKQKKSKEQAEKEAPSASPPAAVSPSTVPPTVDNSGSEPGVDEKSERKVKKEKKSKSQRKEKDQSTSHATGTPPSITAVTTEDSEADQELKLQKKKHKKANVEEEFSENKSAPARFIAFVGNLPYDVTVDQIKAHFSSISPSSVRLSTSKDTGRGKGFAFVEFDNYDKMKTCLKLYHHSIFDPDAKKKDIAGGAQDDDEQIETGAKKGKGRRINVELTAGGGGKSKERRAKIKTKNHKLGEERERRRIKDMEERDRTGPKQKAPVETGANAIEAKDTRGAVHPSRLSRVSH